MTNFLSKAPSLRDIAMTDMGMFFLFLLLFVLITGCATPKKITHGQKRPSIIHQGTETDAEKIFKSLPSSPASNLVAQGIRELKKDEYELAEWNFEQAITVDPNYGPAYYWLARVKYRQKELLRSLELLRRAEDLLSAHQAWLDRVQDFRLHIQAQNAVQALDKK